MANIRVDVPNSISDGLELVFHSPCDCSEISGLSVYYQNEQGVEVPTSFIFKDLHGHDLSNVNDLFKKGAYVKVILNTTEGIAYIQNADTNYYLEQKFMGYVETKNLSNIIKSTVFNEMFVID